MTDNFEIIKSYIESQCNIDNDQDKYYVVELMRRGKDNPDLPAANIHFKNYYINRASDLDKYYEDITKICYIMKMRAYVSVNYKSYEQVLKDTVVECARRVAVHNYAKPYSIFESCSGKYFDEHNKRWLIDIDKEDCEKYGKSIDELCKIYSGIIENCEPGKKPIIAVPTKSGMHLVTHPFNLVKFNQMLSERGMEIHSETDHQIVKKNHLTLLFEDL